MGNGWIKLHRELLEKPIWEGSTPEQKVILVTLLAMANHKEKEWEFQGEKYKASPGQFVTSLDSIVKKAGTGISIRNVRTALQRFEKYGFLTNQSTNKNRLITIVNWGLYQDSEEQTDKQSDRQLTSNRQATDKQLTTNKNVRKKEGKNDKEIDNIPFSEVIDYLNEKAGTNYRSSSKKTQQLINARYKEKFTLDDFKTVIDKKTAQWLHNTQMNTYLRPETLFGTKFESYLNEKVGVNQYGRQGTDPADKKQYADGLNF